MSLILGRITFVWTIYGSWNLSVGKFILRSTQVAIDRSTFLGNRFSKSVNELSSEKTTSAHDKNNNVFHWHIILNVGVVVFTKDLQQEKFDIRLVNMVKGKVILSQEIEKDTIFRRKRRFITIFETQFGTVCLNFVDNDEADVFMNEIYKFSPNIDSINRTTEDGVKQRNSDDSNKPTLRLKNEIESKQNTICTDGPSDSSGKGGKKPSLADKFKSLFNISRSFDNRSKKKISKEYFQDKIGESQFEKLVIFLKVAGRNESDFDDPGKAREILQFYEEHKKSIDMIQPEREEEYGVIDDIFETPYEEDSDEDEDETISTEATTKRMSNNIIKRMLSYDESGIKWSYDDTIYVDSSSKPPLPPKFKAVMPKSTVLPPKPIGNLSERVEKILSRQISRPSRPAPAPPEPSSPSSDCPAPDYANSRKMLMRAIREQRNMQLKPVNEKTTKVPPNSPNPTKEQRRSLASVLSNALKKIHDVNIVYGEDPTSNEYWDEK